MAWDVLGNLEAAERLDLPLWTTVKRALTAPQDAGLAEELQHLANDVRPDGRERDDRRRKSGANLCVDVSERRRQLDELRCPGNVRNAVPQFARFELL